MVWTLSALAVFLLVGGMLGVVIVAFVWRERPKAGSTALAVTIGAHVLWVLGQTLVVASSSPDVRLVGYQVTVLGIATIPFAWLAFGVQYTGRLEHFSRPQVAGLAALPIGMAALVATNAGHGLVFGAPETLLSEGGTVTAGFGPALWGYLVVAYVTMGVADSFLVRKFVASRNVYRKRTFWFLLLNVTIAVTHLTTLADVSPLPHLTAVPVVYTLLALVSLLIFVGFQSLEFLPLQSVLGLVADGSKSLAPVARDTVIEEMGSGMLVLDHKNRVVDINPAGRQIVGGEDRRVIGKNLEEVIPPEIVISDSTEFYDPTVTSGEFSGLWVQSVTGEPRCYDVTISALELDDGGVAGRVGIVHDVTDREQRKQKLEERATELERQNDQLENFASIVSHDLRNPLNVAKGSVDLAQRKDDPTFFDRIRQAHDRMEDIIDEVLTLARQGKTVDETEPLEVDTVAAHAWDNVETPQAELVQTVDRTVEADRGRFMQVFENLFRNSVEHGSTSSRPEADDAIDHGRDDVEITVGPLENGFFVADDGPGIPEDQRDDVLDQGFTTSETGTGFGLSIVSTIVEAHGWDIDVTESTDGGARFEIRTHSDAADSDQAAPAA